MVRFKRGKDIRADNIRIKAGTYALPLLILRPARKIENAPGVLWIHGGGYILGFKEMAYMGRAADLVRNFGAVVVSPGYRLAARAPYPAALEDCYAALLYMKEHAADLSFRPDQLMVGGESAGGGLAAVLCILARDRQEVSIAYQMPLYPMLDNLDTETSRDNHAKVWNTRRNHLGWKLYLRGQPKDNISSYAAAARCKDYAGLPPAYTFVGTAEPFYAETVAFIDNLRRVGIEAELDVYPDMFHAFDMLKPQWEISKEAIRRFESHFQYAMEHYFKEQI